MWGFVDKWRCCPNKSNDIQSKKGYKWGYFKCEIYIYCF
jgi:hypothetical protein